MIYNNNKLISHNVGLYDLIMSFFFKLHFVFKYSKHFQMFEIFICFLFLLSFVRNGLSESLTQ